MVVKIPKNLLMYFAPVARVFGLSKWAQDTTWWQFFFSTLYLFGSIFSGIVWTNIMHDFDEEICFFNNCCYRIVKRHFLNDQWKMLQEEKRFIKKMQTSTEKTKLIGYFILCEIKLCNLKNVHFLKKEPKKLLKKRLL